MKKVFIYGIKESHNLGGFDPSDRWSRDSTRTEWNICGCDVEIPPGYVEFDSIETNYSGNLYALYAINSSGNSFGRDEQEYFTLIWVFNDLQMALNAKNKISDHATWYRELRYNKKNKKYKSEYSVDIEIENDILTVHAAWNGYFEKLDEIDIYGFHL